MDDDAVDSTPRLGPNGLFHEADGQSLGWAVNDDDDDAEHDELDEKSQYPMNPSSKEDIDAFGPLASDTDTVLITNQTGCKYPCIRSKQT